MSGGVDIFGDPRKMGWWLSPGKAGCFTCFPDCAEPSQGREVQAASVTLDHLGLAALKMSRMQILRKHLDREKCWNKYIY